MRTSALALALLLLALPGAAQETDRTVVPAEAGATEAAESRPDSTPDPDASQRFTLDLELALADQSGRFDPDAVLEVESEREFRAMLWSDPLARSRYQLAAEQAMLGREGLVHGGHMVGVGLGGTVLGDGTPAGAQLLLSGTPWSQLSGRERVRVGFEVAVGAGLLWALANGLGLD